jgi:hypothetical protein
LLPGISVLLSATNPEILAGQGDFIGAHLRRARRARRLKRIAEGLIASIVETNHTVSNPMISACAALACGAPLPLRPVVRRARSSGVEPLVFFKVALAPQLSNLRMPPLW